MEHISNELKEEEIVLTTTDRFKIEDELWLLGFSVGLPLASRRSSIAKFVSKWENNLPHLKRNIERVKNNPDIKNKGAYLRKLMIVEENEQN